LLFKIIFGFTGGAADLLAELYHGIDNEKRKSLVDEFFKKQKLPPTEKSV
jgi:hypothetical protein